MVINLLVAIKQSKKRIVPSIEKRKQSKPFREYIMRWIRVLSPLKDIPINLKNDKRFFLDAFPSPNSKAFAVINEFKAAGISSKEIFIKELKISKFKVCTRLVYYSFLVLPVLVRVFKNKTSRFDEVDSQVLMGYVTYKIFLKNNKTIIPIIISDITPTAHMLWAAAVSLNREVFWWQDDYHHYNGFSDENYFPYTSTCAAVLNQKGLETVLKKSPNAKVFYRNQTQVKLLRLIPNNPKVGLATNAFFEATESQIEFLEQIKLKLNIQSLNIRLHPNSRLTLDSFPQGLVDIAPKDETIEFFAKSVDIAIVGNSAVQLKLLCEGVPVIHIAGLDNHKFDTYQYCKSGFCYGSEDIGSLNLSAVQKFYLNPSISERLFDYVNVKDTALCEPLSKLITKI